MSNLNNLKIKVIKVHCKTFAELNHVNINEKKKFRYTFESIFIGTWNFYEFSISLLDKLQKIFLNIIISFKINLSISDDYQFNNVYLFS